MSSKKISDIPSPTRFSKKRRPSFHTGSQHSEDSKQKMREGYFRARERAIEERGYYLSEEGKKSQIEKLSNITPERRAKFREETTEALKAAHEKQQKIADEQANKMLDIILDLKKSGLNLREVANKLNEDGHRTARGRLYIDNTVRQILKRTKKHKPLRDNASGVKAAKQFARKYLPIIQELQKEGLRFAEIATRLNEAGYRTRRGCLWIDNTVRNILKSIPKPKVRDVSSEVVGHVRIIGWDKRS